VRIALATGGFASLQLNLLSAVSVAQMQEFETLRP